jgi:hypothetical protein
MLSGIMLNVVMLIVVMLIIVMLSVVTPCKILTGFGKLWQPISTFGSL